MGGLCDTKGAVASAAIFVASGMALGVAFELADAMDKPAMYATIMATASTVALAISCVILLAAVQHEGQYAELLGWCRDPDVDEHGVEQPDRCRLATGVKAHPMRTILFVAVLGCLTAASLLTLLPMGYALTGDRVSVKYDLLMMLLIAPVFEIRFGGLTYTFGQKVAAVITSVTVYITLSACPCTIIDDTVREDVYLQDPVIIDDESFVDIALLAGILMRWAAWCAILYALQHLYGAMHGTYAGNVARVRFFAAVFLLPFTAMAGITAIDESEERLSADWFILVQIVLAVPFIVTFMMVLSWRGVYFVTVMVAINVVNRSFFRVVCTPYSLSIFGAGLLLTLWYQASFWSKVPWDMRKTRYYEPADMVIQMEEVGAGAFKETVHTDFKENSNKTQ